MALHPPALQAYLLEHHKKTISWHDVLNNHASTRPPVVEAVTDCKEFKEFPAEGAARWQCTLTLPNSFEPEDGRRLQVIGEGGSRDAASELACLRAVVSLMSCPGEFVLHPCHWDVPTYDLLANLPKADPASGGHQALPVHTPARLRGAGEEADTGSSAAGLVEDRGGHETDRGRGSSNDSVEASVGGFDGAGTMVLVPEYAHWSGTHPSQPVPVPRYAGAGGTTLPDQHEVRVVLGGAVGHPDTAVYCQVCDMWLSGESQLMDHLGGRKHRRNLRELRLG